MNDRERVLLNIAIATSGSCFDTMTRLEGGWSLRTTFGALSPQFLPLEICDQLGMPLEPGDIVRCETNRSHAWSISQFVKALTTDGGAFGSREYLCREIGGTAECRIHNESLAVLRFMPKYLLYTGKENQVYAWCHKAFLSRYNPDADMHRKRCGGVDVQAETVTVWSRPHIFFMEKGRNGDKPLHAVPRRFEIPWNRKTRLKDIVRTMKEQGFAKDYDYAPEEPTEGMGGCCRLTRDKLVSVLESAGIKMKEPVGITT